MARLQRKETELERLPNKIDINERTAEDGILLEYSNYSDPRLSYKQITEAILKSGGMLMDAAKILKCHYNTLHKYINRDIRLQNLCRDIEELNLDAAENTIRHLIKEKNLTATIFYLKCKGRKRGWIEDEKTVTQLDKPIVFNYKLVQTNNTINNNGAETKKLTETKVLESGNTESITLSKELES